MKDFVSILLAASLSFFDKRDVRDLDGESKRLELRVRVGFEYF
jgi:hypothetical protein